MSDSREGDDGRMRREMRVARSFEEAEEVDLEDWLKLSNQERMMIGERMRETDFGPHEPGLVRELRVVDLGEE